jgi:hypothetical protein
MSVRLEPLDGTSGDFVGIDLAVRQAPQFLREGE